MLHSMPSLSALRAFEAAARLGSVTAAAEELSVTHGAVSRQLRSLEEHFGVALFAKAGRGLELTSHGQRFQRGVGEAFARLRESCTQLKRDVEGSPFILACPGTLLARWLIPRLDHLHRELPELKLHVVSSESDVLPGKDEVSATLTFSAPPWPAGVEVIELAAEQICAVVSPSLASRFDPEQPATLFDAKLLHTASRPQAWPHWVRAHGLDLARLDRALVDGQGFDHLYYLMEAAVAGLGVAIAPRLLVEDDLRTGRLVAPWGCVETPARLCLWLSPSDNPRRSVRLVEWLRRSILSEDRDDVATSVI
ncbi:LysR family transcriptional regulator [Halomonas sp. ML-15]|uniref:LysR family transcriptional regulator n=1 Tax=Halomonas sp. ML-15 TaxID=2773305 RepID=UPI0017473EA2|nr:LysR family transcriptional regulator [Halomonas sp. ML-15]MBD3897312.1 LysR family transcriptional regulator [Halomonas sp. ML-15]